MSLYSSSVILALAPPAAGQSSAPGWVNVVPLVLMMVVFYFILIRPQQKKAKEHQDLLKSLKPGDRVLASGGIVAVVVTVKDKNVTIRSGDAKFEVLKSAITEITERAGTPAEA